MSSRAGVLPSARLNAVGFRAMPRSSPLPLISEIFGEFQLVMVWRMRCSWWVALAARLLFLISVRTAMAATQASGFPP